MNETDDLSHLTTQQYFGDAAATSRVRRRVASTNLFFLGSSALIVAAAWGVSLPSFGPNMFLSFVIPVCFVALWGFVSIRSHRTGVRGHRIGYRAVALASVGSMLLGMLVLAYIVGPLAIVGIGFTVIGWRERCAPVWLAGACATFMSLALSPESAQVLFGISSTETVTFVRFSGFTIFAVTVLALATWWHLRESRIIKNR